jgi:pyruvate formate lyase activating enzyme
MDEEGIVFDIQGYSIHDGPGIRTLVFLKGCHLRCPWCSNPESQRFEPELFFHPERCIGCQKCLQVCSRGAIGVADGKISFNRDRCQNCGQCSRVCYAEARVMKGRQMTADRVVYEVLKDALF